MSWTKWEARLRGEKVMTFTQPDEQDEGFYRRPIREKAVSAATGQNNGQWKTVGWSPVAIYLAGNTLVCVDGEEEVNTNRMDGLWPSIVQHPITEAQYRAVAEHGEAWHDSAEATLNRAMGADADSQQRLEVPAADRTVTASDNGEPILAPHEAMAKKIKTAVAMAKGFKIKDDDGAAMAAGIRNRLNELKLEAQKEGEGLYKPIYTEYKRLYDLYIPMAKLAEDEGKTLFTEIKKHEQRKRDAAAAAEVERLAEIARQEEEAQRAIDRAIVNGTEPELPAAVYEVPAEPVPAPVARVVATYGRAVPIQEKTFVEIDDLAAVFQQYRGNAQVIELLTKLAQADVTAGLTVPGTHTRKGVI